MKNIKHGRLFAALILVLWSLPALFGQATSQAPDPNCSPTAGGGVIPLSAVFNYGSSNKMKNNTRRMKLTVGQMITGSASNDDTVSNFGFWTNLLVAPQPPIVRASQGEDPQPRIRIEWSVNPLGSFPTSGFKIYRDGVYLAQVDKNTRNYNDFDIIPGTNYTYTVRGVNNFGDGPAGTALGFQVPDGVATGWVHTQNGNPVPGAMVCLSPMQGTSAYFGPFDGATATADAATASNFLPASDTGQWSITFWVKTLQILDDGYSYTPLSILQMTDYPYSLNIDPSNDGIRVQLESQNGATLTGKFPSGTPAEWHNVALTFDGSRYRLYLDGTLVDLESGGAMLSSPKIDFGENTFGDGSWNGFLDELRIYHRRLDELDLREVMAGTASSITPGLKYYWKMDEGAGKKAFDRLHRTPIYFCGAIFGQENDAERAPVATAGITNEDGYYRIEGVNYGTGKTYLAKPKKDFYKHKALQFDRDQGDYAWLPDFPLSNKSTIEVWLNESSFERYTILDKRWGPGGINSFILGIEDQHFYISINGTERFIDDNQYGNDPIGYNHLAVTIDRQPGYTGVSVYRNGVLMGSRNDFPAITGDLSEPGYPWLVGATPDPGPGGPPFTDHFDGQIDEVAVYDTTLSETTILAHAQNERNPQERGLRLYFPMDEGTGSELNNAGSFFLNETGMGSGTEWTIFAPNQVTTPHIFAPSTRQVTLNPSITSVDQVDFTDRSSVAVSGFVRYQNTDCFAKDVEILVNGQPYSPKILTDSTGKFVIDFEPGFSPRLTPKFADHEFSPEDRKLVNVNTPVAGLVFNDVTIRKITGQIAGGQCRMSVIPDPSDSCLIRVSTRDECFVSEQTIVNSDGQYEFDSLPPLEMTIAIIKHNIPAVFNYFENRGGYEIDLTKKDSMGVDFIYFAPPTVGVDGFDSHYKICNNDLQLDLDGNPLVVIEEDELVQLDITVYEQYGLGLHDQEDLDNRCRVDTAVLTINNTFDRKYDFREPKVDSMLTGKYDYDFLAAHPNTDAPYLKLMQITANANGREGSFTRRALITGIVKGEEKFTTVTPMMPNFVLRDPPGDHSYAYLEKGETICNNIKMEKSSGEGTFFTYDEGNGSEAEFVNTFGFPTAKAKLLPGIVTALDAHFVRTSKTSMDFCLSAKERISTDDGDLVVGGESYFDNGDGNITTAGNDLYVGTAFNLIISESRYLSFNDATCEVNLNTVTSAAPDSFATTYMYSEWNIQNNVIRYLDSLIGDAPNPADSIKYSVSKQRWLDFIDMNRKAKDKANFKKNISWDAGAQYEYAETRDTTQEVTEATADEYESRFGVVLDAAFEAFGVGMILRTTAGAIIEGSITEETGEFTKRGTTVGYVLKDDDPGDTWTMDVKDDPLFKTPVFKIKAGQTSCPWEVGTAHREGMVLEPVGDLTRLHVPSNGEASFQFLLRNNSQSGETFTYALTTGPESNPYGAKIFLNGAPLDHYVYFAIPWGTTIPVTVTVERGPVEYNYDGLELILLSECHDRRCNTLGVLPDLEPYLYSARYLTVHFEEPCSEVDISFPRAGWVVKQGQDIVPITISGYDKNDDDLNGVRLQYRREGGDDVWINIVNDYPNNLIPKAELGEVFKVYNWDTGGAPPLPDGPYEIRAITECIGDANNIPGISHLIKGKIERQPPSLIGTPEPSDGVYQNGDEISFSFNKEVNCNKLNPLDDVLLFDATTDQPINIDITCKDNKIILNPKFDNNEYFENKILRAELHNIEDLVGNKSTTFEWEFYVDRNELGWLTDSIGMTKYEDENKTVVARIHNRGGYPVPFKIRDLPTWVHVVPDTGVLAANEIRDIRFEVDSSLAFGLWADSITLHTVTGQNPFFMGGDERLPLGVRVVCRPPDWDLNAGLYPGTMNLVLKVDVQGQFSTDGEDIVAAYIGDELRGRAHVQYVPQVGAWLAYLTVYGDTGDVNDPIRLEVWDASACLRYGMVQEPFTFQPETVVGIPTNPQVIHTNSLVLREIPLGNGWNWVSFNLAFPNPLINPALASLKHPQNDLIKDRLLFDEFYSGSWIGSLTALGNTSMYQYRADQPDTLKMLGNLIDPAVTHIPVSAGWNWIGYIPNYALPVNNALASLTPQTGDLIKSQTAFAQYINPAFGWVGNLKFMSPPNGYQIKLSNAGILTYPPPPQQLREHLLEERGGPATPPPLAFWTIDPTQFEYSMTLVGMLAANGSNSTTADMELGAFAGNELRGATQAIYIEPLQAYLFFLTTYANASGEPLHFKLFDAGTGLVQTLNETLYFAPNLHQGSIQAPMPFTLQVSGATEASDLQSFDVQPNPFSNRTTFRFVLPHPQEIVLTITDAGGREVLRLRREAPQGLNAFDWDGRSGTSQWLGSGVYMVRLQTESGSVSRKVVLQRLP